MKVLLKHLFVVFLWLGFKLNAQQITFQKEFGDYNTAWAHAVEPLPDGSMVIAGGMLTDSVMLMKLDPSGDTIWNYVYCEGDAWEMARTNDNGFVLTGVTDGDGDILLLKTDSLGGVKWSKRFGGVWDDWGLAVCATSDGGVVVAGDTESFAAPNREGYLIKTDNNGNLVWSKTFNGGSGVWGVESVIETSDGDLLLVGMVAGDMLLLKTDMTGNTLWHKTYGGSGYIQPFNVGQTSDGGFLIGGATDAFGSGDDEIFLAKTDSSGNALWAKTYGNTFFGSNDAGFAMDVTSDDGVVLSGRMGNNLTDPYLIKTDQFGDTLWTRVYDRPGPDYCWGVKEHYDKGYILAVVNRFAYVIKTDSLGFSGCHDSIIPLKVGTYTLTPTSFTITDTFRTIASSSVPIILKSPKPNVNVLCEFVNVQENQLGEFNLVIYPNPTKGKFIIEANTEKMPAGKYLASVLDVFGRRLYSEEFSESLEVNASGFPSGIYVIQICDGREQICRSERIVIQ